MKKSLCLLGILCLMVLEYQCEVPAFANTGEEPRSSVITIEEFVRSLHPHGVSVSDARKYKSPNGNPNNNNVEKLLGMLDNPNEKPYWSTIVVTLGLIGDPSVVPGMIAFIGELEDKSDSDRFESRALSSAIWALGIAINEGRKATPPSAPPFPRTDSESVLGQASNFLIMKSKERSKRSSEERKKATNNRQSIMALQSPNHETSPYRKKDDKDIDDIVGDPYILGLAFADTDETKKALLDIRDRAVVGSRNREWLDEVIRVQEEIHKAGDLLCYREPKSSGC